MSFFKTIRVWRLLTSLLTRAVRSSVLKLCGGLSKKLVRFAAEVEKSCSTKVGSTSQHAEAQDAFEFAWRRIRREAHLTLACTSEHIRPWPP